MRSFGESYYPHRAFNDGSGGSYAPPVQYPSSPQPQPLYRSQTLSRLGLTPQEAQEIQSEPLEQYLQHAGENYAKTQKERQMMQYVYPKSQLPIIW